MIDKKVPVETYSRVVGFFRPVHEWNKGKQSEWQDRRPATLESIKGAGCIK